LKAENGEAPGVSIILVSYNDDAHLPAALSSIDTNGGDVPREVIVVDNASTDRSPDLVAETYPDVMLLRNESNEGFGRANNRAVRESRGELLLFMNTDVVLFADALELLVAEMKAHPETGAAGPALRTPSDGFQASYGGRTGFFSELAKKGFLNRLRTRALRAHRRRREVGWVSGAFLLVRRKAFVDAGGFDEEFFLYFEDIDLCERLRKKGWRVVFLPAAAALHRGGATTSARPLRSRVEYRKSQLRFYRKHGTRLSLVLLKLYVRLTLAGLRLSGAFLREPDGPALRDGLREALRAARREEP
jgi:GT2 family glycosyltransferase